MSEAANNSDGNGRRLSHPAANSTAYDTEHTDVEADTADERRMYYPRLDLI